MPMTTMQQRRAWTGPAVLGAGFRPFFLAGSACAALAIGLWVPGWLGLIPLPSGLPPVAWHIHEVLFGYVSAVIAGFLLTAIPNWTGRLPVAGASLAGLLALWLAGRIGVALAGEVGIAAGLGMALVFPIVLIAIAARELVAGGAGRNLPVIGLLAIFACGQAIFAGEVVLRGSPDYGHRIAIAAVLVLVTLIGGRIIPSFTTNWLRKRGAMRLPAPFGRLDAAALLTGGGALALWAALSKPEPWAGALLVLAGALHLARQLRWSPLATRSEPLLWVLHAAYLFVAAGFLLAGAGHLALRPDLLIAAVHVWGIGGIGLMTLAVMTRASRGHTGRSLAADGITAALYVALVVAVAARVAAALAPEYAMPLLWVGWAGWLVAFGGFAIGYGPMLCTPRT